MKALAVPRNGSVLKAMVRSSWRILFRLFQGIFCGYAMRTLSHCMICAHVHDELIIECREDVSLDAICEQMGRIPPWAEGLVLRADGYCTPFYKKELKKAALPNCECR